MGENHITGEIKATISALEGKHWLFLSFMLMTGLAFSSHRYVWLETDWIPTFFLDKMAVVKLFLSCQVYILCTAISGLNVWSYKLNLTYPSLLARGDFFVETPKSRQHYPTRFLYQQDFRLSFTYHCSRLSKLMHETSHFSPFVSLTYNFWETFYHI